MTNITFVTSLLHIYENEYEEYKTVPWRVERFQELVDLGIHLCVYISPEMEDLIRPIETANPDTVKIMRVVACEDTMIAKMLEEHCPDYKLPEYRNEGKDKSKYSIVINSKTEFMSDSVYQNPWNTTHFAWIDFNITYVFSNKEYTYPFLKWMSAQPYIQPDCFVIPGCWDKYDNENSFKITNQVNWRFCGGFFLGDAHSILRFHELYEENFPRFLKEYGTLVWEVNFWAWLERNSDWNPRWYWGDHNDTIVCNIPVDVFASPLVDSTTVVYPYPQLDDPIYRPSSASYLDSSDGRHLVNTRYVNYLYHDEGYYQFFTSEAVIRNKNVISELDPANQWRPVSYREMVETVGMEEHSHGSRGIEDIRLYEHGGKIKYIATTMGYHTTGGTRMVVGEYCVDKTYYENSRLVDSPENNHLEKNWVPLAIQNRENPFYGREVFVYKWSPLQIGELCEVEGEANLRLQIVETIDTSTIPHFRKLKGSSGFIHVGEYLVGVVHFTEEAKPRRYYHMLVALDPVSLRPVRYSDPFCFEKCSIEFCIGFRVYEGEYMFWISRMDRDPALIRIDMEKLPLFREILL